MCNEKIKSLTGDHKNPVIGPINFEYMNEHDTRLILWFILMVKQGWIVEDVRDSIQQEITEYYSILTVHFSNSILGNIEHNVKVSSTYARDFLRGAEGCVIVNLSELDQIEKDLLNLLNSKV